MFTINVINKLFGDKQLILAFLFCFSEAITTTTTMATTSKNAPLAPHTRPCARRRHIKWMGDNPPSLRMYFWGGWGCLWPSKRFRRWCIATKLECLRAMHTPTAPNIISACSGGYRPSIRCIATERKVSCGALGGHFRRRWLWSAMVVMVNVGRWRPMSDRSTVGIVEIVYGSIFFYSYIDPIHSWHLTRQLKKKDLDLRTLLFSWFLCPVFYGRHLGGLAYAPYHQVLVPNLWQ